MTHGVEAVGGEEGGLFFFITVHSFDYFLSVADVLQERNIMTSQSLPHPENLK